MQWGPQYVLGIKDIDNEHQKLVNMINDLYEAMSQGKGDDVLGRVLGGLVNYCATHFATEEKYMQKCGYEDFAEHKRIHDGLTSKVKSLFNDFNSGKAKMSLSVTTFLKDWLNKHILQTDKNYVQCMKAAGIS